MRACSTLAGGIVALLVQLVAVEAFADDAKRPALMFMEAELGPAYVDVAALQDRQLLDTRVVDASGVGPAFGAALGVRLHDFTLAGRYRHASLSAFSLWTLGGEAGMKFSLGRFAPHFSFGAGYASLDGLTADAGRGLPLRYPLSVDISGFNVRLSAGLDYFVWKSFSVGAKLSGDAFFLSRKGDRLPRLSSTDPNSPPIFGYALDGSGNGLGAALTVVLGLHF